MGNSRDTNQLLNKNFTIFLTEPEVIELDDDDIDGVTSLPANKNKPANNNKPANTFVVVQGPHGPILVNIYVRLG
jgi:hypothetical protein